MTFDDLLAIGASAIRGNSDDATTGLDSGTLATALGSLFAGKEGKPDFSGLLDKMKESNLDDIAASWLGNGENMAIPAELVNNILGSDTVANFASQLGLSESSAKQALADALPKMVDKGSSGGSLLQNIFDNAGGLDGLIGMARKFF